MKTRRRYSYGIVQKLDQGTRNREYEANRAKMTKEAKMSNIFNEEDAAQLVISANREVFAISPRGRSQGVIDFS